ncbi:MAG: hypothetical protein FJ387_22035 [Verrucomicrobia bacterium]|nr:hypothetical protein [Verrucomicrobiota bacterium]
MVCLGFAGACRSLPRLPALDLSAPGWQIQQGQAVWLARPTQPALAGDLLVARHPDGRLWVQFTKTPFPLVTAQRQAGQWAVEFTPRQLRLGGRGAPPQRFWCFPLAAAVAGEPLRTPWRFERRSDTSWRLWNDRTGEWIDGYLAP